MLLGTLIFFGACIGSGIIAANENYDIKKSSSYRDKNGNLRYRDRLGKSYANDEQVFKETRYDEYGHAHDLTVGYKTGKVYSDDYDRKLDLERKMDEERRQDAIKRGNYGYMRFLPADWREHPAEVSTGKFISCIYYDGVDEYRKFYTFDERYFRNGSLPGDYGVVITKEEYDNLDLYLGYAMRKLPAKDVLTELGAKAKKKREEIELKKKVEETMKTRERWAARYPEAKYLYESLYGNEPSIFDTTNGDYYEY